ncbi:hypothetical protein [Burkholderia sp. Ac-20353]|uniref:hypothetical protein n=1 Tax=Burkholderia sp. Ac-20353 TaxID=2703894 RepID=UPI00197C2334|nr:hypothetical protein [Burkholderia sp. Ac-20353]MBN3790608.1 hypothetical protein [Burkholderia sp. Ac-20353]
MNNENAGQDDREMQHETQRHSAFVKNSSKILEFTQFTLRGTGIGETLCDFFVAKVGGEIFDQWMAQMTALPDTGPDKDKAVHVLLHGPYGALTRNLLSAWYTGVWSELPAAWRAEHLPAGQPDEDSVISVRTYQEALVWPLVGAHPPGAKQQGWAAWSMPPSAPPLR